MEWHLDFRFGFSTSSRQWAAHSRTPNEGAKFAGTTATAVSNHVAVTGGADSTICVWELTKRDDDDDHQPVQLSRQINGAHGGAVTAVTASVSPGQAITGGQDGIVRMWSKTGDQNLPLHQRDARSSVTRQSVTALELDHDNHRVLAGGEDSFVRMWDLEVAKPTRRYAHACELPLRRSIRKGVQAVAFNSIHAELTQLVSAAADGSWKVWDVRQNLPVQENPEGRREPLISIAFRRERLLTASVDGLLQLWDIRKSDRGPVDEVNLLEPYQRYTNATPSQETKSCWLI